MKFKYFGKPDFNEIEVDGVKDKKMDITIRPDTSDSAMIKECITNYSDILFKPTDVVMDLGANIGGFGKIALDAGIKHLICFEPDPFNFELLSYNLLKQDDYIVVHKAGIKDITLFEAAVVGDDSEEVTFVIKDNKNSACSGKVNTKEKINENTFHKQTVKALNFDVVLDKYKPTIVKIDIEGGEYYILNKSLPHYVEVLALELHGFNKSDYLKMFKVLNLLMEEWDVDFIDPICVFQQLQLMNIVLSRKDVIDREYDFSDIDAMNIRSVKFDHIPLSDLRPLKGDGMAIMELLKKHYNEVIKPIIEEEKSDLYD